METTVREVKPRRRDNIPSTSKQKKTKLTLSAIEKVSDSESIDIDSGEESKVKAREMVRSPETTLSPNSLSQSLIST